MPVRRAVRLASMHSARSVPRPAAGRAGLHERQRPAVPAHRRWHSARRRCCQLQRRPVPVPGAGGFCLTVGLQCGAASAVCFGLPKRGDTLGLCCVQGTGFFRQDSVHPLEGQLYRPIREVKRSGNRLSIPAQGAAGFVGCGKDALCGSAGSLSQCIGLFGFLLGGIHLRLRGGCVGQLGLCRVVDAAAHGAGRTSASACASSPACASRKALSSASRRAWACSLASAAVR